MAKNLLKTVPAKELTNFRIPILIWLLSVLFYPLLSLIFPDFFIGSGFSEVFLGEYDSTFWQIVGNAFFMPLLEFGIVFLIIFIINGEVLAKKRYWSWILRTAILVAAAINFLPIMQDVFAKLYNL
jgi:hypothetical protein